MFKQEFGPNCSNWDGDPRFNRMFLKAQEDYANELLSYRGYVLLSQVYGGIGIPLRKKEELTAGWVLEDWPIEFHMEDISDETIEVDFNAHDITNYFED